MAAALTEEMMMMMMAVEMNDYDDDSVLGDEDIHDVMTMMAQGVLFEVLTPPIFHSV